MTWQGFVILRLQLEGVGNIAGIGCNTQGTTIVTECIAHILPNVKVRSVTILPTGQTWRGIISQISTITGNIVLCQPERTGTCPKLEYMKGDRIGSHLTSMTMIHLCFGIVVDHFVHDCEKGKNEAVPDYRMRQMIHLT